MWLLRDSVTRLVTGDGSRVTIIRLTITMMEHQNTAVQILTSFKKVHFMPVSCHHIDITMPHCTALLHCHRTGLHRPMVTYISS